MTHKIVIPSLGLGMRSIPGNAKGKTVIQTALNIGYRLFDTTPKYGNEKILGDAIRDSNINREEIFVITKIGIENVVKGDPYILDSIESSLFNLNIDYIDLLLLENPFNGYNISAWHTLVNVYNNLFDNMQNKIKAIGVSNYSILNIDELIKETNVPPMFHQYEISPFSHNKRMTKYCDNKNIRVIGHTCLANYHNVTHNAIKALCIKRNVTPAQLLIRWCVQHGYTTVIGTTNIIHLKENIDISKFCLSFNDFEFMKQMNTYKTFAIH